MWWTALIGPVVDLVKTWSTRRSEVKQAEHQARLAAIAAGDRSWKDEYIVLIWSFPVISMFIPGLQDYSFSALDNLSKMPNWYLGGWLAISLSVFGIKELVNFKR